MDIITTPLQPKVVLGVAAHPDDLEYGIAGSVAAWARRGATVYYHILTNGNRGTADRSMTADHLQATRGEEQRSAAETLGVKEVFFSNYEDGCLEVSHEVRRDICRIIRKVKPDVVLTFDPTMVYDPSRGFVNHPDHRAAGQATLDAVYPFARDHMTYPELLDEGLEPHITPHLLLVNFTKQNFFVDITETLPIKLEALAAHTSQISDMEAAAKIVTDMATMAGTRAGVTFAEGFVRIDIA